VQVDTNGCPLDSDNDGVADYLDKCPNTPADARPVDANGCPVDSDNDGVPDYLDRCPNTPAGTPVDASGCPFVAARPRPRVQADTTSRATPALAVNGTLVLRNVVFHPNSARLPPEALAGLDSLASALRDNPNARWEIGGHTSNMGDAAQNLRLSQRRALAVKTYLVRQGVPAASLVPRGYGSATPIATNATVAGRRQNMRVELTRLR
jgi:OOP family OmpA-OmpF porin